jgi:hypothetical protein
MAQRTMDLYFHLNPPGVVLFVLRGNVHTFGSKFAKTNLQLE